MTEKNNFPQDFDTADELVHLIDEAHADAERGPADRRLYNHFAWLFNYTGKYFPEAVSTPEAYEGAIIKLVDTGNQADPKAYKQGPHRVYIIDQQLYRTGLAVAERYVVNRRSYDPDFRYPQAEMLLNMEFDPISRRAAGIFDEAEAETVLDILSSPDLMFKAHLDETWLAWRRRCLRASRLGRTAIRYPKPF